jgi:hypothetical protein
MNKTAMEVVMKVTINDRCFTCCAGSFGCLQYRSDAGGKSPGTPIPPLFR